MPETLTFIEAARRVLEEADKPLHYREITEVALRHGWLDTAGKTPWETLNARLCVDLKRQADLSAFVRTEPGTFGLRVWVESGRLTLPQTPDRAWRVRVPHYPNYDEVRAVLPVWRGLPRGKVTGLLSAIDDLTGSPQAQEDWTDPATWIPERLQGEQRELALRIWKASKETLNPRYMVGHWALASLYELVVDDATGLLQITGRGQDFIERPDGDATRSLDEAEGLLKLLALLAELSPADSAALAVPWRSWLDTESRVKSDSYARATLYNRLRNLRERGLSARAGQSYTITEAGLAWLRATGVAPSARAQESGTDEEQQIRDLLQRQTQRVREQLLELLREMDPYAFEHLIAALLEALGYEEPTVTSPSNDKGVDVVARIQLGISEVREVVQVKRQKGNIGRPVLDALRGSLHRFQAVRGTIITTGGFASGTKKAAFEAGAAPITLIDGERLVDLLMKHQLGAKRREVVLWELDPAALAGGEDE